MNEQVAWLLELSVRPGQLENLTALMHEMVESTRNEQGTLAYEWSLHDLGDVCHIYQRFADSGRVVTHLTTFGDQFADRFLAAVVPVRLTVYGTPNDAAKEALSGLNPTYMPPFGGFTR
jgi:quinol monooxygenase YgiN